jgi:Rha family phage regulatory protein
MDEIILKEENGQVLASSREVAEKFGKRHDSVLRDIDNLIKSDSTILWSEMFRETTYTNSRGKNYRCFDMNRDGFSLLCMGFTGKEALEWKLKYINAFNQMEEKLKSNTQLTEEEKYKLMLFSKDASEVAYAHNKLVEIATAPLVAEIKEQKPKVEYHDDVLNKEGLITTTVIAKDLGFKSATKLNKIMNMNKIIFKNQSGTWCPYADYEWLISDGYADYQSYTQEHSSPCLKWTEKGRKWIIENYNNWVMKLVS